MAWMFEILALMTKPQSQHFKNKYETTINPIKITLPSVHSRVIIPTGAQCSGVKLPSPSKTDENHK